MVSKRHSAPNAAGAAWIASTRELYGLSKAESARMCCVTEATWRRWESGEYPMNPCIFHYWLSVLEKRLIPRAGLHGKRWNGWFFEDGQLVTPHGERLGAAQIESQQEHLNQTRETYRQMQKAREHAKSGLQEAGMQWYGWQFTGGFLTSPDGRKISAQDLYVMIVGHDAMLAAKQHGYPRKAHQNTDVIQLQTK